MPNVKVEFTQVLPGTNQLIESIVEDKSDTEIPTIKLKWWATILLHHKIKLQELQGLPNFKKRPPIQIKAYIDGELVAEFTQKRVTGDIIIKEGIDLPFSFLGVLYVLVPNDEKYKKQVCTNSESKISTKGRELKNFDSERYFNAIEYLVREFPKISSPILFTGWTQ